MKPRTDSYFELLPVLVIALALILADQGRNALKRNLVNEIGPIFVSAPEAPRLFLR